MSQYYPTEKLWKTITVTWESFEAKNKWKDFYTSRLNSVCNAIEEAYMKMCECRNMLLVIDKYDPSQIMKHMADLVPFIMAPYGILKLEKSITLPFKKYWLSGNQRNIS